MNKIGIVNKLKKIDPDLPDKISVRAKEYGLEHGLKWDFDTVIRKAIKEHDDSIIISGGFLWHETPEKEGYWNSILNKFMELK